MSPLHAYLVHFQLASSFGVDTSTGGAGSKAQRTDFKGRGCASDKIIISGTERAKPDCF